MPPRDLPTSSGLNANSALIGSCSAIILAVLGWVGMKTASGAEAMARVDATLPFVRENITELKAQLVNMITRSEYEARTATLERRINALEKQNDNSNHK